MGNLTTDVGGEANVGFGFNATIVWSLWIAPMLLLAISVIVKHWIGSSKGRKLNLPPMPKGWPVVGTMLQTRGPQTHNIIKHLAKEYGSLFALRTGLKYFIVVASADIAHDALIKDGATFSTRAKLLSRLNFTGWRSVNSALYGPYWRGIRKNLVAQVLSTSRVAAFQPFRTAEMNDLIERVRAQARLNDNVVPVLSNCRFTMLSLLLHVCFSKTFKMSEIEELDVILRRLLVLLAPQVIDFLPFLQLVSKRHRNECQMLLGRMAEFFDPLIEEHRELRKNGTPAGDYVDSLIVLEKEMDLARTDILSLIGEVLTGGTDTTANAVEWAMGNLIQNPQLQAKLFDEIHSICGEIPVGEDDVDKLPYLHAVVKETLRKHPPLPFAMVHGVTKQTKLRGHDIPEDAMVLFHIQALQNNPSRWDHPEIFNPERFVSEIPNPDHDMTGSHGPCSMNLIPFGAGRRICPAMNLALKHVHLLLARLVQTFEWSTPIPGEDVDFSDYLAFTCLMSKPLLGRVKERFPK